MENEIVLYDLLNILTTKTTIRIEKRGETLYVGSPMVALETFQVHDTDRLTETVISISATDKGHQLVKL
jgi:hypothetical protein